MRQRQPRRHGPERADSPSLQTQDQLRGEQVAKHRGPGRQGRENSGVGGEEWRAWGCCSEPNWGSWGHPGLRETDLLGTLLTA